MERETHHEVEIQTTDEFWDKVEAVLSKECATHDGIDDVLRSYLALLSEHHHEYITTEHHLGHCAYLLYASDLFTQHSAYIRQQLIYCLLQEDDVNTLRITVVFLLADARENEHIFELLNREGIFPRLVDLIAHPKENEESLHRSLMELMYELSRVQTIGNDDLTHIDDDFVCGLFNIIEQVSDDVNDPYHYPVIRVILVLNEQFMVAAYDPARRSHNSLPLTNKVVKVLSAYGNKFKIFGANIILLLNREDETSLQLLTLKLMYLLFTTPPTYQYFYTNDLRVLVDILVRNLLDLPEYAASLRHTYLRVLYPLLEHTQLQDPPYYKREEIRKLLALLCGERVENKDGSSSTNPTWNHFEAVDDTTRRLVKRCQTVSWLTDPEDTDLARVESPTDHHASDRPPEPDSPTSQTSPTKTIPPQLPAPRKLRKRDSSKASTLTIGGFLTPQLEGARTSSISMAEMAQHKEKPGVITPSRNPSVKHGQGLRQAIFSKKEKPPPPKTRRSGFLKSKCPPTTHDELHETSSPQVLAMQESRPDERAQDVRDADNVVEKNDTNISGEAVLARVPSIDISQPVINTLDHTKKPPPAPKARRGWRMRKSKDENVVEEEARSKDPGKFSSTMPSTSATNTEPVINPFSPPTKPAETHSSFSAQKEKTLDPTETVDSTTNGQSSHPKKSISHALQQAQEQVVHQVEERLEAAHIVDDSAETVPRRPQFPIRDSSLGYGSRTTPHEVVQPQRVVLAPPSEAPIRAVPGPRVDLEKSPFLSDDEERDVPTPEEGGEDDRQLRTKESWEEFDHDV